MDQIVKHMWVDALKSGEYTQGRYKLRNKKNEFCCLGVLCNIYAQQHPELAATQTIPTSYLLNNGYLPKQVAEWAGIERDEQITLAEKNDFYTMTFNEIANYIKGRL